MKRKLDFTKRSLLFLIVLIMAFMQFSSAVNNITGYVESALDGESSNGKIVTIWNPANGILDNVTGIIGPSGSSGKNYAYSIDCELLGTPCVDGDNISAKVFGNIYVSNTKTLEVNITGPDIMENLSLNSPPQTTLNYPQSGESVLADINFNCSYFDYDNNIQRVGLWVNQSGTWQEISFQNLGSGGGDAIFSQTLSQNGYVWNCLVRDDLGIESFASNNNSFFVDTTDPVINYVSIESLQVCGFGNIQVNCSTYDQHSIIGGVLIESIFEGVPISNYTANLLSGNIYSANPLVNDVGNWSFRCYANDSAGNNASLLGADEVSVFSGNPELSIVNSKVNFNKYPDFEQEPINVSVEVRNSGCVSADSFIVGFFNGEKPSGDNFANQTVSVSAFSDLDVSSIFYTEIGYSNIFVYTDLENTLSEDNESNNEANNSMYLKAWQKVFGNLSLDKVLIGNETNFTFWAGESIFNGNIFVADTESDIQWTELQSIGRTKIDTDSSNDFLEMDNVLGMGNYNDSIYQKFTNLGVPKDTTSLFVFQNSLSDVPYINSSSSGNFITGILWDTSDSLDDEYDSTEAEDVVFVTQINMSAAGEHGIYDYEIDVPAKLRSYDSGEESEVYLYYDLN